MFQNKIFPLFTGGFTRQQMEEYRKTFGFFDANDDGHITFHELELAMNRCGMYPTKLELRLIMRQADRDRNGVITFDEFLALMRLHEKLRKEMKEQEVSAEQPRRLSVRCPTCDEIVDEDSPSLSPSSHPEVSEESREELLKEFQMFDKDNDGYITLAEMETLVVERNLRKDFPAYRLRDLFRSADINGDGRISFDEFAKAVC